MTDEEMKKYADEHWKCIVYCRECKYATRKWVAPRWRVLMCYQHEMQVEPEFWCAYGEKKGEGK